MMKTMATKIVSFRENSNTQHNESWQILVAEMKTTTKNASD